MAPVGFWGLLGGIVRYVDVGGKWGGYVLDDDEFRVWLDESFEFFQVGEPFVFCVGLPQRDFSAEALGDRVELLVGWVVADDMISWSNQRIQCQVVGGNRTRRNQDVLGRKRCSNFAGI